MPEMDGRLSVVLRVRPAVFHGSEREPVSRRAWRAGTAGLSRRAGLPGQPAHLAHRATRRRFPGERLVVVSSPFFPHKLSKGYESPFAEVVKSINGVAKSRTSIVWSRPYATARMSSSPSSSMAGAGRRWCSRARRWSARPTTSSRITACAAQGSADTLAIWNAKKVNGGRRKAVGRSWRRCGRGRVGAPVRDHHRADERLDLARRPSGSTTDHPRPASPRP